ncbi:hypothetical protein ACQKRQ_38375 [Paraburkholderia sp. NPDC080076]|uniref:hypothetical protein n=1 Tax=Paraburkholderia sp. NPDC080076 TaxID=3390605 RepID=UPI003D0876FD
MIARTFLDFPCDGGVNAAMDAKLTIADNLLRATYAAQFAARRFTGSFTEWAQIRQSHGVTHPGGHAPGDAMDVNYDTNSYIATRTPKGAGGVVYGGEAPEPPGIRMARLLATTVYDRAMAFFSVSSNVANVSARASVETTTNVFLRFKAASDSLRDYFGLVFLPTLPSAITNPPLPGGNNPSHLQRRPVANAQRATLHDLLAAIPKLSVFPMSTHAPGSRRSCPMSDFRSTTPAGISQSTFGIAKFCGTLRPFAYRCSSARRRFHRLARETRPMVF